MRTRQADESGEGRSTILRRGEKGSDPLKRDYRKWGSPALERDMELVVFGEGGTPVLFLPT